MHTFLSSNAYGAQFNRQGTRLLSMETKQPPVVWDVPQEDKMGGIVGKVRLTTSGFSPPDVGRNTMCFAGKDDELVVAALEDHNLHVGS